MYLIGVIYSVWVPIFYAMRYIKDYNNVVVKSVLCIRGNKSILNSHLVDKLNESVSDQKRRKVGRKYDVCHVTYTYKGKVYKQCCKGYVKFPNINVSNGTIVQNGINKVYSIGYDNEFNDVTELFKLYMGPNKMYPINCKTIFNSKKVLVEFDNGEFDLK